MTDRPYVQDARKALAALTPAVEQMASHITSLDSSDKELSDRVTDLTRRLRETEQRAILAEQQAESLSAKARHNDRLEETSQRLLDALDRLPLTMDDAGIVPGATKPAIPLYGTYDWQTVMEAKFSLKEAIQKGD